MTTKETVKNCTVCISINTDILLVYLPESLQVFDVRRGLLYGTGGRTSGLCNSEFNSAATTETNQT